MRFWFSIRFTFQLGRLFAASLAFLPSRPTRLLATGRIEFYTKNMKTLKLALGIAVVSIAGTGISPADSLADAVTGKKKEGEKDKLVFVTGSRIPQRVQVKAVGTNTTSQLRVYTRAEIERTGKFTTEGILAQDPSVRIIGNGSH